MTSSSSGPAPYQNKVSIYLTILQAAAGILGNPVLGIRGVSQVIGLIGYAGNLVRNAGVGSDELRRINTQVKILAQERRAPTPEEWATWRGYVAESNTGWEEVEGELGAR